MSDAELQDEEREVLSSIYDGDECFKQISPDVYQYKYGENDTIRSFLLEIKWGPDYPTEKPEVNLNAFYNKHIVQSLKDKIINVVLTEADQYLGMSMTYSLFEFVKEKFDDLIQDQPEDVAVENDGVEKLTIADSQSDAGKKAAIKKEQLTKAQKRRQWDKADGKGEKPRGWDWVDIVKHLSQTGGKDEQAPVS